MASGITHILLMKNLQSQITNPILRNILAAGRDFLQLGAIAPDLPYASIADNDFILTDQSDLADHFHYRQTNRIGLDGLAEIKNRQVDWSHNKKLRRYHFNFILGYISHVVADGVIHPFVRDTVGDYNVAQTAHRVLEMRLDVLFYAHLNRNRGAHAEFNYANIHDELENLDGYSETDEVISTFQKLIRQIYAENYKTDTIRGWITGLHRLFDLAEGDHPAIYKDISFFDDYLYPNFDELLNKAEDIYTLEKPIDRDLNFLHNDRIHFIEDCVPQFYTKFVPIAEKAYQFVYKNGRPLTEEDIPAIDLDTGRLISDNNDLDQIPAFWR